MLWARRAGWVPALWMLASACSLGSLDWLSSGRDDADADAGKPGGHAGAEPRIEAGLDAESADVPEVDSDAESCGDAPGCDAGQPSKRDTGARCSEGSECKTELCVDGVCCDLRCDGPCRACSAEKKGDSTPDGACGPVRAGFDPDNECEPRPPTSCETTGVCDGAGSCAKHPNDTICKGAVCSDPTQLENAWKCVEGMCVDSSKQDCTPYTCDQGACRIRCAVAGAFPHCAPGYMCINGACRNPAGLADGAPCSLDAQCASGYCTDNFCCGSRCDGLCVRCNGVVSAPPGVCAQLECTDPERECAKFNANVCHRGQCYLTCPI